MRRTRPVQSSDSPDAWDLYWHGLLHGNPNESIQDRKDRSIDTCLERLGIQDGQHWEYMHVFEKTNHKRVLFAGNGLRLLPYFYEHRGFEVVSLDISRIATEYTQSHPPSLREWRLWLLESPRELGARLFNVKSYSHLVQEAVDSTRLPGGSLEFMTEDLGLVQFPEASFDVVFLQRVANLMTEQDCREIAHRMYRWLAPQGVLVIEQRLSVKEMNDSSQRIREEVFIDSGFQPIRDLMGDVKDMDDTISVSKDKDKPDQTAKTAQKQIIFLCYA